MSDPTAVVSTIDTASIIAGGGVINLDSIYTIVTDMSNIIIGSQRSLAMQWFVGNLFFMAVAAAYVVIMRFMSRPPMPAGQDSPTSMSTKKFAVITGIFVAGLVFFQIILQLIGILSWCALFGIGTTIYLKGRSSWFIRQGHSIPTGWSVVFFLVVVIMILVYNTLPAFAGIVGER